MLKLRKRLFLILSMVGVILCLVSCIPDGYIKLKFDEELYTIKVGEKLDFMPTVVKDSHESNYELVYESSEQTIATYIDGILTGLKEGTTELKVFVKDNPSVYATTTIQVVYTETLDVEFDVKDRMLKGQTYKISYVLQEGCIDPIITYRSNDDKILTVDNDGYVLAVSKGTTQIIARVTSSVDGIQYREYVFDVTVLEEIYEIEYVLDGGINHPNNPTSYTDSDLPVGLNNPSKTGYTFDGWYLDAECTGNKITELDASMSGKVTLYAKWIATKYTIDYQLDGGLNHPDNPQGYDMLTLPIELLEPTKEDHQFLGWYLNDQLVDKLEVGLEGDITLYAKWEQIAYFITFELDGGVCDNLPTKYFIDEITLLPVPTKEGFKFLGWYFNDEKITAIEKGTTGNIVLSAKWREDALYVGVGEDWYYSTLQAALDDAKEGSKIIILAGEYNENVTISLANLTIVGPNAGTNPNTFAREEEAVLTGVITVLASANNFTMDGLSFTKGAKIVGSENKEYHNFKFVNNLVYDTNASTTDWVINRYVMKGFVEFNLPSGGSTNHFYFANNRFTNVSDVNLLINRVVNLSVEGNVFLDFDRDAIRCEGGYNQGIISFTNNYFEQSVQNNGYNAIFMYALSGPSGSNTIVYVLNNTFKQIGTDQSNAVPYNGAISAHIFQENKTAWEITGNIFDHCYNYMWLRNNGASTSNWSCKVDNNQFLGLPTTHYFGTYQGSDTETTNPHLAEFGANYYENNEGEVITDLTSYASLFKHLKTSGTTLATKPIVDEAKPLEFYVINYELDGGTLKGNYPTAYNSLISEPIVLPTPTKLNCEFLGWSLNGDYVTEIPSTSRGDIVLVAEWKVLEGEIYDVTYIFNGGYSEEYLVAHSGNAPHLTINNYNYNNGTFWGGRYTNDIFIGTSSYDPAATFSDRIYIAKNLETGLYEIVQIISSGASSWPEGAEYVITISNSYNNYWASINPITTKLTVGQMVAFDQAIEDITADEPATVYFFSEVPEDDTLVVPSRYSDKLIVPGYLGYKFLGWYDSEDNLYTSLETLNGDLTLYAKWEQLNPVTNIRVDEICDELETGDTFQIVASVEPSDAYFKDLFYESSNTDIITVSSTGLITAINAGKATITIYDYLRKVAYEHEITVNSIQSVDITFEEHYDGSIHIDDTLQIIATAYGKGTENAKFIYESSDENILTVSETGLVTALANGKANVLVTIEGTQINLSVCITVGVYSEDTDIDRLIALLARNNFAVVETGNISLYNDGVERVYVSTYGSVNRYLFDEFKVDETYYATSEANPNNHKERRSVDTIEFVTVHDTATLTGTVVSIAQGMSSGETSIHYTVGNDAIYGVVPEKYIAYHAGDGTSASFTWTKTNAVATSNIAPQFDVVQSGSAYYLSLNGTVTQIEVPTINGAAPSASYLSILGPTWKVENGYYYIGEPLWYSSSYNTIGSRGGNNNSIGIEMCSNLSGDIYDTFQRTAQLVADILLRNDLDTTRVKMHNTWSGKNCPQTMISGSYWDSFMEMVELQYEIQKNYSNAKISIQSNNPDIIDNTGRVIKAPAITTTVSYDLTVELNGQTKTITLHSIVPGTTTWEQWDGTYPASRIWNNGVFAR